MMNPDYELALLHMPVRVRPAMGTLFEIDAAMGEVVARSTDPRLGRIKLAWWREQLEALDHHSPPGEPRLRAVAEHLLPARISGAEIAELEAGWATLLDEGPDVVLVAGRGAKLFQIAGRLLPVNDPMLAPAGELFALQSAGLVGEAEARLTQLGRHRFPRALRPLTMLTRGAAHELRGGTSRTRVLAMLAHRWTGRIG